jgi:hypothetical protein
MIVALLALAWVAPQSVLPSTRLRPVTSPVRDAGILHVASNTWTRRTSAAALGLDVVYDNTCSAGYIAILEGNTFVDEGRLPSPTSPTTLASRPGCATSYTIDGFQLGYCANVPQPAPLEVAFFPSYVACTTATGLTPAATIAVSGLPGGPSTGPLVCWSVTIDLGPPPDGSGLAFAMAADGDGTYVAPEGLNRFGWSIRSTGSASEQQHIGPLLAAEPNVCQRWDGTRWDDVVDYDESGTGMGTYEGFRVEGGPLTPGCYFQESPFFSLHLELYADACPGQPYQTPYCAGDLPNTPCPCGNGAPNHFDVGCLHSLGVGGRLRGGGTPSVAADTLVLSADFLPSSAPSLFFQGTARQTPALAFGDGLRCVAGTLTRIATRAASGGAVQYPLAGDASISVRGSVNGPGTRYSQVWYRNAATFCTPATFNLTNGWEVRWTP